MRTEFWIPQPHDLVFSTDPSFSSFHASMVCSCRELLELREAIIVKDAEAAAYISEIEVRLVSNNFYS